MTEVGTITQLEEKRVVSMESVTPLSQGAGPQHPQNLGVGILHARTSQYEKQQPNIAW